MTKKMLNPSEKLTLKRLLRDKFDERIDYDTDKTVCIGIINIAKKIFPDDDFVDELESAYNLEFNN